VAAFLAFTRYLYLVTGIAWDRNVSCFVWKPLLFKILVEYIFNHDF
jgi:hypothetical protein